MKISFSTNLDIFNQKRIPDFNATAMKQSDAAVGSKNEVNFAWSERNVINRGFSSWLSSSSTKDIAASMPSAANIRRNCEIFEPTLILKKSISKHAPSYNTCKILLPYWAYGLMHIHRLCRISKHYPADVKFHIYMKHTLCSFIFFSVELMPFISFEPSFRLSTTHRDRDVCSSHIGYAFLDTTNNFLA